MINFRNLSLTTLLFILFSFAKVSAQTVYITEIGKKYHVKNCPTVKPTTKTMELKAAKEKGYLPCVSCGADTLKIKEEKVIEKKKEEETPSEGRN